MTNNVLKKCYSWFLKDYKILKLIFFILASLLIVGEFYVYVVEKPTYTSTMKREFVTEDIPEMLLCPHPAIDIDAANSKGYIRASEYFRGINHQQLLDRMEFGWSGNKSETVQKVSQDIATLKKVGDCPPMGKKVKFNESVYWSGANADLIQYNLTKALFRSLMTGACPNRLA